MKPDDEDASYNLELALLDNMKEDPAKFFRYRIPKDKRRGVKSGKDW
ncbi:MAG: hypothetical protein GY849_04840 [Deltaproteobacteria bacterium]|nr:hypothetical protein [Deltaproteobacteria bacterium]